MSTTPADVLREQIGALIRSRNEQEAVIAEARTKIGQHDFALAALKNALAGVEAISPSSLNGQHPPEGEEDGKREGGRVNVREAVREFLRTHLRFKSKEAVEVIRTAHPEAIEETIRAQLSHLKKAGGYVRLEEEGWWVSLAYEGDLQPAEDNLLQEL